MSEARQETVDGILREWRDMVFASKSPAVHTLNHGTVMRNLDRIEAAWKREKAEIEADALAVGGVVEASRHSPGNAAAMREALMRCEAISCLPEIREQQCVRDMRNIIANALSAPARNCDKYDNFNDALRQFVKERPDTKKIDEQGRSVATVETYCVFANWLLTPAAERKGECDGR